MTALSSNLGLIAELRRSTRARDADPYDRTPRETLAELLLEVHQGDHPFGTAARGRMILQIIAASFPTPALSAAYFANLQRLLDDRPILPCPGQVVFGLGPGRCGSTSLAGTMSTIAGSCCTHENPPIIYWEPLPEQVAFHLKRVELLRPYVTLVFDAAHWWINVVDPLLERFPDAKFIGLIRDVEACVQSFIGVKGSINHWVPPRSGVWATNVWDPAYPSYSGAYPSYEGIAATGDVDEIRRSLIHRYVADYYARLDSMAATLPSFLPVRLDEFDAGHSRARIFSFIGMTGGALPLRLNVRSLADGGNERFRF
jgi:hypothetical protein